MQTFFEWLSQLREERNRSPDPAILRGYDLELHRRLQELADDIQDPQQRTRFEALLTCPIVDGRGNCRGFAEYIVASLLKQGIDNRFDVEQALQYVIERMLLPKTDSGGNRTTLFTGFDPHQEDAVDHFRARFMSWLRFAVQNIKKGKIRRLSNVEQRPQGTVSINVGRTSKDEPAAGISPEAIPARRSNDADFHELVSDITTLLKGKEAAYGLPLSAIFTAMLSGMNSEQQRKQFGDTVARNSRPIIVRLIADYARTTNNYHLMALVQKFKDFKASEPTPAGRQLTKPPKTIQPVLDPQVKDFSSIMQVIDRFSGQPVSTATLGSLRRRWYDYPSRTPGSAINRLDDTLQKMVGAGVLRTVKGAQGALLYLPGPNYERHRQTAPV